MKNPLMFLLLAAALGACATAAATDKPRVIATTDGEIDDECSMVRFLLYANEWDVEGIITSSSQYHWQGHKWAGDNWMEPYLKAYAEVYPNLIKHDPRYPTPEYLRARTLLGNVKAEGEMTRLPRVHSTSSRSCWMIPTNARFGSRPGAAPTPSPAP